MKTSDATIQALKEAEKLAWEETWCPIPDFPSYEVSDFGNVRSYVTRGRDIGKNKRQQARLLKQSTSRLGYKKVYISRDGVAYRSFATHRLVALVFIGPIPPGMHVAHLNGNPGDNRLANLKICTPKENASHKVLHGTAPIGEKNQAAILQGWQVEEILYLGSRSIPRNKIAALFDVPQKCVGEILAGRNWAGSLPRNALPSLLDDIEALKGELLLERDYGCNVHEDLQRVKEERDRHHEARNALEVEAHLQRIERELLVQVAEAADLSPCRHSADWREGSCATCIAVKAWRAHCEARGKR